MPIEFPATIRVAAVILASQTATAYAVATGDIVDILDDVGVVRLSPVASVTGVRMAPVTVEGREVTLRNESAYSVTFAAAETSLVADGAASPLPPQCERRYTWSGTLWYGTAAGVGGGSGGGGLTYTESTTPPASGLWVVTA